LHGATIKILELVYFKTYSIEFIQAFFTFKLSYGFTVDEEMLIYSHDFTSTIFTVLLHD